MIPGKISTSLAEFQGIVSVNDFRIPISLQELLQDPFSFLRSFCFTRIRLNPFSNQVLHHHSISMIVSRFTSFTKNFVICCYQVTIFSARGTTSPVRLLHGALVILVVWQISQFRSFGKCVKTLWLPGTNRLCGSKQGSWEELACESPCLGTLSSTRFPLNSCSRCGISEEHGLHPYFCGPKLTGCPVRCRLYSHLQMMLE